MDLEAKLEALQKELNNLRAEKNQEKSRDTIELKQNEKVNVAKEVALPLQGLTRISVDESSLIKDKIVRTPRRKPSLDLSLPASEQSVPNTHLLTTLDPRLNLPYVLTEKGQEQIKAFRSKLNLVPKHSSKTSKLFYLQKQANGRAALKTTQKVQG